MKPNEVEKFFEGLPKESEKEADIFDEKGEPKQEPVTDKEPTKEDPIPAKGTSQEDDENEPRKNRRHRRLEAQLEAERRSNIELNKRVMDLIEAQRGEGAKSASSSSEMPPEWVALYGDTPEAQKAWKIQEHMLSNVKTQAKEEAIREIEERQNREREEQRRFESFIDSQLESLEDAYDVDLTSDSPAARKARRELLDMVTELSPKDEDGVITGYADFDSTFKVYQRTQTKVEPKRDETVIKAKQIAGRSMQQSSPGAARSEQKITPGFRGWMKDYEGL